MTLTVPARQKTNTGGTGRVSSVTVDRKHEANQLDTIDSEPDTGALQWIERTQNGYQFRESTTEPIDEHDRRMGGA